METTIREEILEEPINISKFKFTCDDADTSIPKPLPQQGGFAMLIIGKPRSGKTNLLLNLTTKAHKNFNRKFDRVFLFSPSVNTMENDPFELLPDDQKYEVATEENIKSVLEMIKDTGDKVLLILDDCISDIRGKGGSLSIIATSQTYNKIDPKLRKTCSHLILFENKNKKELDSIFDEVILIPKKEFFDVLRYIYDRKYRFMYIDTTLPDYKMIHKDFNQLEVSSPNIMGDNYFANALV